MELVERAYGFNIFSLHLEAMAGHLPDFSLGNREGCSYFGKGIVYARRTVTMPETEDWREKGRDIPFPGEIIAARRPICTVLAQGETRDECWHRLLVAAEMVWQEAGNGYV
jgi:predicted ATP-grasp superfamily ATP-dependent carboligase